MLFAVKENMFIKKEKTENLDGEMKIIKKNQIETLKL